MLPIRPHTALGLAALGLTALAGCVAPGGPRAGAFLAPLPNEGASEQFDRIKSLAGNWQWAPDLAPELEGLVATYRLTAGGTAVLETLFPGDTFEMVTLYHLDGDQLICTHYSTAGNQPSMRAEPGDPTQPIRFECIGATGIDSERDDHMHMMSFLEIGRGQLVTSWTYQVGGLDEPDRIFKLVPYYPPEATPSEGPAPVEEPTAPALEPDTSPVAVAALDPEDQGDALDAELEALELDLSEEPDNTPAEEEAGNDETDDGVARP